MQRYFSNKKNGKYLYVSSDDIYHIKTVMRLTDGDKVEIVFESTVFECFIENAKNDIKFLINKQLESFDNNIPLVTLVIPLLKENKIDLILQKATEMNVANYSICQMKRCRTKLHNNKYENKLKRWQRIIKEASEQSKRIDIPKLEIIDNLNSLKLVDGLNFTCSVHEKEKNIKKVLTNNKNYDRISLVIGPEGGLALEEEELLIKKGFVPITLGSRILRVETVPLFLMSIINYEFME